MRSLRARAHRGSVVVTGGGLPVAMTGDEARAFARLLDHLADQADPIGYDRAFGEDLVEDVPAPRAEARLPDVIAELNCRVARARANEDVVAVANALKVALSYGYELRPGATAFTPIGKAPHQTGGVTCVEGYR